MTTPGIQIATTRDEITRQKERLAITFPNYADIMADASAEYPGFVIKVLKEQGLAQTQYDENSPVVCQLESKLLNVMGSAMFQRNKKSEVSRELQAIKQLGEGDVNDIKQIIVAILNQTVDGREPAAKYSMTDDKVIKIAEKWAQSIAALTLNIDKHTKEQGANARRAHGQVNEKNGEFTEGQEAYEALKRKHALEIQAFKESTTTSTITVISSFIIGAVTVILIRKALSGREGWF